MPGALLRNRGLRFLGRDVHIAAERLDTPFTHALAAAGQPLRMPIAHGEGCYFGDDAALDALEAERGVLFRYVDAAGRRAADDDREANPNGSLRAIAGVIAPGGNVAGLMPHPGARGRGDPRVGSMGRASSARWSTARPGRRPASAPVAVGAR